MRKSNTSVVRTSGKSRLVEREEILIHGVDLRDGHYTRTVNGPKITREERSAIRDALKIEAKGSTIRTIIYRIKKILGE